MSAQDPLSNSEKPAADQTIGQRFLDVLNGKSPGPDHLSFVWVLRFENQYLNQMKELLATLKPAYWAIGATNPQIHMVLIYTSPIKKSSLAGFSMTSKNLNADEYKKFYTTFATWKTPAARPLLPVNIDGLVRKFVEENPKTRIWSMDTLRALGGNAARTNSSRLLMTPEIVYQRRGLTCFWLYGSPGTGKTLYWEEFADFYGFESISQTYCSSKYFPFYGCFEVLVLELMPFDISRRGDSMGVDELLRFVEEGVFYLKGKGRHLPVQKAQNQAVFIVAWCPPDEIKYDKNKEKNSKLKAEVLRRIHFIGSFKKNRLPIFQKGAAARSERHKFGPVLPVSWLKSTGVKGFDHLINGDIVRWEDVEKEGDKK